MNKKYNIVDKDDLNSIKLKPIKKVTIVNALIAQLTIFLFLGLQVHATRYSFNTFLYK